MRKFTAFLSIAVILTCLLLTNCASLAGEKKDLFSIASGQLKASPTTTGDIIISAENVTINKDRAIETLELYSGSYGKIYYTFSNGKVIIPASDVIKHITIDKVTGLKEIRLNVLNNDGKYLLIYAGMPMQEHFVNLLVDDDHKNEKGETESCLKIMIKFAKK